jgi:hypothetical protein
MSRATLGFSVITNALLKLPPLFFSGPEGRGFPEGARDRWIPGSDPSGP